MQEDLDCCRARARVIVINDAYRLAPWADLLHASDRQWWRAHWDRGAGAFAGIKTGCLGNGRPALDFGVPVLVLPQTGCEGLETNRELGIRTGSNSGHQAINLAYLLSGGPLYLLGFDMQPSGGRTHWHGEHEGELRNPRRCDFDRWQESMAGLAVALRAAGVAAVNCSRETALTCFPRRPIEEALR